MPFSFRKPVQDLRDINMNNDIAGINVPLNIIKDFDESLKAAMEINHNIKNSVLPYCSLAMQTFLINTPYNICKFAAADICD